MKKSNSRGKHLIVRKSKKNKTKKVILYMTLSLIVFTIIILNIPRQKKEMEMYEPSNGITEETMSVAEGIMAVDMPDKIGDFDVIGQLVIEKINFNNYILSKTTEDSLNSSITKFYGPQINQKGNFCITGHNTKESLFKNLKELEKEDTFYMIAKESKQKVVYQIYDKYTVNPTDLKCLNQDTNKREVTLITCNPRRLN